MNPDDKPEHLVGPKVPLRPEGAGQADNMRMSLVERPTPQQHAACDTTVRTQGT